MAIQWDGSTQQVSTDDMVADMKARGISEKDIQDTLLAKRTQGPDFELKLAPQTAIQWDSEPAPAKNIVAKAKDFLTAEPETPRPDLLEKLTGKRSTDYLDLGKYVRTAGRFVLPGSPTEAGVMAGTVAAGPLVAAGSKAAVPGMQALSKIPALGRILGGTVGGAAGGAIEEPSLEGAGKGAAFGAATTGAGEALGKAIPMVGTGAKRAAQAVKQATGGFARQQAAQDAASVGKAVGEIVPWLKGTTTAEELQKAASNPLGPKNGLALLDKLLGKPGIYRQLESGVEMNMPALQEAITDPYAARLLKSKLGEGGYNQLVEAAFRGAGPSAGRDALGTPAAIPGWAKIAGSAGMAAAGGTHSGWLGGLVGGLGATGGQYGVDRILGKVFPNRGANYVGVPKPAAVKPLDPSLQALLDLLAQQGTAAATQPE